MEILHESGFSPLQITGRLLNALPEETLCHLGAYVSSCPTVDTQPQLTWQSQESRVWLGEIKGASRGKTKRLSSAHTCLQLLLNFFRPWLVAQIQDPVSHFALPRKYQREPPTVLFAHFTHCSVQGKERKNTQEQEGCRTLRIGYFRAYIQSSYPFTHLLLMQNV